MPVQTGKHKNITHKRGREVGKSTPIRQRHRWMMPQDSSLCISIASARALVRMLIHRDLYQATRSSKVTSAVVTDISLVQCLIKKG